MNPPGRGRKNILAVWDRRWSAVSGTRTVGALKEVARFEKAISDLKLGNQRPQRLAGITSCVLFSSSGNKAKRAGHFCVVFTAIFLVAELRKTVKLFQTMMLRSR